MSETTSDDFSLDERFAALRSEVEDRWADAQARVDQKLSEVQELLRTAINDLSDKVDAVQARWEEREPEPPQPEQQ